MKLLKLVALFCLIGAVAAPLSGSLSPCDTIAGNLVANCGFETGDFTGWTTGGNASFTLVVNDPAGANSGGWYMAGGPVGSDDTLSQTLSTSAGATYTVSFFFAIPMPNDPDADTPSDFAALWNGTPLLSLTNPDTGGAYTQFLFLVTGTGTDTLQFNFRDDPGFVRLDDVVVVAGNEGGLSEVPEPGTIGLVIAGFGAAILVRRRRRA